MSISRLTFFDESSVRQDQNLKRPHETDSSDESQDNRFKNRRLNLDEESFDYKPTSFYDCFLENHNPKKRPRETDNTEISRFTEYKEPLLTHRPSDAEEVLFGCEESDLCLTTTYDHSWERRLNAQKESRFSNANKMQLDEHKLVAPIRLNPNRVMPNCDRNIPSREAMRISGAFETYHMPKPKSNYDKAIAQVLFPDYRTKTLLFNAPKKYEPLPSRNKWKPPTSYYRQLEAPDFVDAIYTNNFHWGKKLLGINLGNRCYAQNMTTKEVSVLHSGNLLLTCLKWSPDANLLALGNEQSSIMIFDVKTPSQVLNFSFQLPQATTCINWLSNTQFTAANYGYISHLDSRSKSLCWQLDRDLNTICSLEWSPDATCLARGGDDNTVEVFDIRNLSNGPVFTHSHLSTIRSLKWSTSSILFSAGLRNDDVFRVFNTKRGEVLCEKNLGDGIYSMECLTDNIVVTGLGGYTLKKLQFLHYNSRKKDLKQIGEINTGALNTFPDECKVLSLSKDPNSLDFGSVSNNQVLDLWRPDSFSSKSDSSKKELEGSSIFSPPTFR